MNESALILHRHLIPQTGQVFQLVVQVNYGLRQAQIEIHLEPPLAGDRPETLATAEVLRELAEVLLRIAEKPAAIASHAPHRS